MPYREVADLEDLDGDEAAELWSTVTDAVRAVKAAYQPGGVNVGINLGRPAGVRVSQHLHVHVVPKWTRDGNFITAIANTRTLPETLRDTADRLRAAWPRYPDVRNERHRRPTRRAARRPRCQRVRRALPVSGQQPPTPSGVSLLRDLSRVRPRMAAAARSRSGTRQSRVGVGGNRADGSRSAVVHVRLAHARRREAGVGRRTRCRRLCRRTRLGATGVARVAQPPDVAGPGVLIGEPPRKRSLVLIDAIDGTVV